MLQVLNEINFLFGNVPGLIEVLLELIATRGCVGTQVMAEFFFFWGGVIFV